LIEILADYLVRLSYNECYNEEVLQFSFYKLSTLFISQEEYKI